MSLDQQIVTPVEFLAYLRQLNIQVWVEGDLLRCNAPAGILTPELRSILTQRKPELIDLLRQVNASASHPTLDLVPVRRDRVLPLSFAQQRLWFLDRLVPENPFYNMPAAIRLNGQLNRAAMDDAFNEIVRRHETLRTSFAQIEGQPTQVIAPSLRLSIPVVDLQAVPTFEREVAVRQIATEQAHRPFDLTTSPLLRVQLLQMDETDYVLLLNLHHIVSDGWSMGVLIRELGALYTAFVAGESSWLPALPIQYADFAYWQRQWLQGEVLESQLSYWRQQLQDIPVLNLPTDRPRPAVQSYKGAIQPIALSQGLTKALAALSQQAGVTLFMTLLAAFQTLLYRYSGETDIAVGSPIANRNRSEIEQLIGFFVNSLVLRTDLSGNPTFRELLGRVREVALAAYAHQDLPFEKLVEELHPERDLSRNPLFQVAFALQNAPIEQLELPGLTLTPSKLDIGTARFDLEFHLWERSQGLSGLWEAPSEGLSGFVAYSTELFEQATIARMVGHFQTLLEAIVTNPDQRLADLPLLSAAQRHQLLVEWNQTQVEYAKISCIHHLFEAQVEKTPDAVAVVFKDVQLTYRELNKKANCLAHYLQQLGVGPEVLVGICVNRSLEMIVASLGVWKAGGAYIPLDPDYPRDRLILMLTDAQVPILLTQQSLVNMLPKLQAQIVCLDTDWEYIAKRYQDTQQRAVTADNLAYVIYTSGSTGTPKGVMVPHRGLCNVVEAQKQSFNLQPGSQVLQFSSLNFDASIFEMLMAFGVGGTLCVVPKEARLPGADLVQFLQERVIAAAILPPAVLAVLPENQLPTLTTVLAGGEACSSEIVKRWAEGRRFFNAYGPTETTIWATVAQLEQSNEKPSIGRPVANTQIYLLDTHLQPVPVGVVGELYIGGDGVARGYLNRPDLTAERFIPNFYSAEPGARLYRTGDLARYRADGKLEFIGRTDEQVKIRGYRIELGEIETVLNQHPVVREAIATVREDESGEKRLLAYVSLNLRDAQELMLRQLQDGQVEQWQSLYDQTYAQRAIASAATFNIVGWNSSYTGQPLPVEQMREWVERRVEQILALQPKRVLEIGCGTGLMLFQIAPHCSEYWGTDFSQVSLDYIQQQLSQQQLPQVKLLHKKADDFSGIEPASFDAVILNSVVQYFPDVDYLLQVLEEAVRVLAPGGFIFVGDVRSLPLLPAFHASVQLHQAPPILTRSQLQQRVRRAMFEETELVIEPALFHNLHSRFPQISHVEIQLSRGRYHNEMTQFRYNALLHKSSPHLPTSLSPHPPSRQNSTCHEFPWLDWNEQWTPATVQRHLVETQPEILGIKGVPNARVMAAVKTAAWLAQAESPSTVGQIREALENLAQLGIDPEDWWGLDRELPYKIEIGWSSSGADRYDVVCLRQGIAQTSVGTHIPLTQQINSLRPWHTYANQPLQNQLTRRLIPQIRSYLEQKLPDYMVPSTFVVLEALPLTANGKVDRHTLPAPIQTELAGAYVAPRSPAEEKLARIWSDLLGVKRVGIHDNFFELGGHSLLATQLISRIRDAISIELPLRSLFEAPTIAELSQVIESLKVSQPEQQVPPAIVPLSREAHRRLRSSLTKNTEV